VLLQKAYFHLLLSDIGISRGRPSVAKHVRRAVVASLVIAHCYKLLFPDSESKKRFENWSIFDEVITHNKNLSVFFWGGGHLYNSQTRQLLLCSTVAVLDDALETRWKDGHRAHAVAIRGGNLRAAKPHDCLISPDQTRF